MKKLTNHCTEYQKYNIYNSRVLLQLNNEDFAPTTKPEDTIDVGKIRYIVICYINAHQLAT
jgi:hypothetical protein